MRFVISDLKRGFTERNFVLSVFAGLFCIALSALVVIQAGQDSAFDLFKSTHGLLLPIVAPLLAAFPYSNMTMIEKQSKYKLLMDFRQNDESMIIKRFFTNGIISGFAVLIPSAVLFVLCLFMGLDESISEIVSVLLLNFLFGAAFGSLSYSLTFYTDKRYIPTIAPQVIYLLLIYSFPHLGLEQFYPPLSFSPWILSSVFEVANILIFLFALVFSSFLFVLLSLFIKKAKEHTFLEVN